MLVLNRRPGESIIIEPAVHVWVLSIEEGHVWLELRGLGALPHLHLSATVVSDAEARLEIGPVASVAFDATGVRLRTAPGTHPAAAMQAGLSITRRVGERVDMDDGLWVAVGTLPKGNPSITFGGTGIGESFTLAVIRPAGSYVRIGVDAPNRRVYRRELWDAVRSAAEGGSAEENAAAVGVADVGAGAAAENVPESVPG